MNEENTTAINYIFYLQTKKELDNNFYFMAEIFVQLNITLLPISANDLKGIDRNKKNYLISIRTNYSAALSFSEMLKSFLGAAMISRKINVFDISSFSEIENAIKYYNKKVYKYFPMPQDLKKVAMSIAVAYFQDRNNQMTWPGGRRSKLPSMTKQS